MKAHPAADLFPMMDAGEYRALVNDVRANGLIHPIVIYDGQIIDGRNRWKACAEAGVHPRTVEWMPVGDVTPTTWIISSNLHRRHLTSSQRAALAVALLPMLEKEAARRKLAALKRGTERPDSAELHERDTGRSDEQAGELVKASPRYVSEAKRLKKEAPKVFQAVLDGKVSISQATKTVNAERKRGELAKSVAAVDDARRHDIDAVCDLRVCSCADLFASGIRPDAVITDPPYPSEFLPVFSELAIACKGAGVPLVAVMSGQSYLPEVFQRLCEHLRYRWTLAYLTPGGQAVQQWEAKVNTAWKPVLLFGTADEWFGDVARSKVNDNDKRFHGWGQSESGMADLVERLTKPGQLVCDPFLGGGTTAVVSLALGRRFVGCDLDAEHVEVARSRVLV